MINIIYKHTEGSQATRPLEVDDVSSKFLVYLRKNITTITRKEPDGKEYTLWSYDEAILTPEEYKEYQNEKLRVDIDYISTLLDIEL